MSFTSLLGTVFKTIAKERKTPDWKYKDLEDTPWLYDPDYLQSMYYDAQHEGHYKSILMHMAKHDCTDIGRYGYLTSMMITKNGEFKRKKEWDW